MSDPFPDDPKEVLTQEAQAIAAMQQEEENGVLDALGEMFGVTFVPQEEKKDLETGTGEPSGKSPEEDEEDWVLV
ncbi:hypothetical protein D6C78_04445 [Aureobasidium pullulans]|uniref:Uncharacterized protein n=1 Tax=Aureobasidium pullulans TaxID=5580 RepID=A0A4T0BSR3_AURPU|nr:hypothetical protein D6C78_04445 [Aureobasidium pullulans]